MSIMHLTLLTCQHHPVLLVPVLIYPLSDSTLIDLKKNRWGRASICSDSLAVKRVRSSGNHQLTVSSPGLLQQRWCSVFPLWKVRLHRGNRATQRVGAAAEAAKAGRHADGRPIGAGVHTQRWDLDHLQSEKLEEPLQPEMLNTSCFQKISGTFVN